MKRVRFQTELLAQLSCAFRVLLKFGVGNPMRDCAERGGILRKTLRVEHELAPAVLHLYALRLL